MVPPGQEVWQVEPMQTVAADKTVEEENKEDKALETIKLVVEAVPETVKAVVEAKVKMELTERKFVIVEEALLAIK